MIRRKKTRNTSKLISVSRMWKPALVALGCTYLGFHSLHGERGIYALFREMHRETVLSDKLAVLEKERQQTELKVSRLRNDSLDLDLLDEQMRRMLGMANAGEVVILLDSD